MRRILLVLLFLSTLLSANAEVSDGMDSEQTVEYADGQDQSIVTQEAVSEPSQYTPTEEKINEQQQVTQYQTPADPAVVETVQQQTESDNIAQEEESESPINIFNSLIVLFILGVIGFIKGLKGNIVVYTNFTDAAVSVFGIWGALLGMLVLVVLLQWILGIDSSWVDTLKKIVFFGIFFTSLFFTIKTSYYANSSFADRFYSICVKLSAAIIYGFYVFMYLANVFVGEGRRKDESSMDYYYRIKMQRQDAQSAKENLIIASLIGLFLAYKLSVQKQFVPVDQYMSFKGYTQDDLSRFQNENDSKMQAIREMIPQRWWTNWLKKY